MSTVSSSLEYNITYWKECYDKAMEAAKLAKLFPAAILESDGSFDHSYGNFFALHLSGPKAFEMAFDMGVVFSERFLFTGANNSRVDMEKSTDFTASGKLSAIGKMALGIPDDIEINVKVGQMPKPPTCIIEKVTTQETRYVTRCAETVSLEG